MARLDRLSTAKEVAQRAAVLGREFGYPLLAAVAGMEDAGLRQGLARLVDAEIVFQRGEPPEATYTFKHALVQEAAYESLLKRTRQQLHGRVVDVLRSGSPSGSRASPRAGGAACRGGGAQTTTRSRTTVQAGEASADDAPATRRGDRAQFRKAVLYCSKRWPAGAERECHAR
jgi:hypothetical protein